MTGADCCRKVTMYYNLIISTLIIFSLFGLTDANGRTLKLANSTCGMKGKVYKGVRISSSKAISTVYSRTPIECVIHCVNNFPTCVSAYRNDQGQCFQLNGINISTLEENSVSSSGVLMKLGATLENDDCGEDGCADDEVCLEGCGDKSLPAPACVKKVREACDSRTEFDNIRHYWGAAQADGRDSGSVLLLTYPKLSETSGLRVIAYMTVQTLGCTKWYFTFNDNQCDNPQPIEMQNYLLRPVYYYSFNMDLDGTCYGLPAGDVRIDVQLDACEGMNTSGSRTGWEAPKSVLVMEVTKRSDPQKVCTSAVSFNYKYESWVDDLDITQNFTQSSYLIKSVEYRKISDESKLKVKYSAYTGIYLLSDDTYCARWYVAIDGTECNPVFDIIINIGAPNQLTNWEKKLRTGTMEGICYSTLPAGDYFIDIYVGECNSNSTESPVQPTRVIIGDQTPSRLSIEEVRLETSVDTIHGGLSGLYRSHTGNLQHWSWTSLNSDVDTGVVLSVTYDKIYTDTALRLTANGAHLSAQKSGFGHCSKWYFTINSADCSDPGVIEGLFLFRAFASGTIPLQVSGVCNGIAKGSHNIGYSVKTCSSFLDVSDVRTGWDSPFTVIAEELRLDLSHTCTGAPADCGP